jgi:plasmid maintenance system antidote protein VapI
MTCDFLTKKQCPYFDTSDSFQQRADVSSDCGLCCHSSITPPVEQAPVPGCFGNCDCCYPDRIKSCIHAEYCKALYRRVDELLIQQSKIGEESRKQEQAGDVLEQLEISPSPPGDTIKDIMEERSISRLKLRDLLDITDEQLSKLLSGIYLIDNDMAYRLSSTLGSTPEFWEERECQYRELLQQEPRQQHKQGGKRE